MKLRGVTPASLLALILLISAVSLIYNIYNTVYNGTMVNNEQKSLFNVSRKLVSQAEQRRKDEDQARLTPQDVGQRFEQRRQRLRQVCVKFGNSSLFRPLKDSSITIMLNAHLPVTNVSVGYCPIEKTSSTTWIGVFRSIRREMKLRGVQETNDASNVKNFTFLFVRDPYARLLSAYTDKLFCPNALFWKMGRYIVSNFRANPSNHSLACGHDVTFPEFVRYVIHSQETGEPRNGHFVPTHDHCALCNVSYDYVGHLETLDEDMPYLLKAMQSPVNYTTAFDSHTIGDNARWLMGRMNPAIRKCMNMKEALLRLWRKWHARGIISKMEPLPVTAEEAEVISAEKFINVSLRVLDRSGPKSERKFQKTEALREAFASVPFEDKLRLQKLLLLDFELFGFDPSPEAVFPRESYPVPGGNDYRYFDVNT